MNPFTLHATHCSLHCDKPQENEIHTLTNENDKANKPKQMNSKFTVCRGDGLKPLETEGAGDAKTDLLVFYK